MTSPSGLPGPHLASALWFGNTTLAVTVERPPGLDADAEHKNVVVSVDKCSSITSAQEESGTAMLGMLGMPGTQTEDQNDMLGFGQELWETPVRT